MQENKDGYLVHFEDWNQEWALQKAHAQNFVIREFDWKVLAFVRSFYQEHQIMPLTRRVIKFIREALDPEFDSIQVQARYSEKPLRLIALLAGVPKPVQCL